MLLSTVLPLAKGQNYGRKTQKGPKKLAWGRENMGPNFWQIYQKRAELFCGLVYH
jgi:hypothetical protein